MNFAPRLTLSAVFALVTLGFSAAASADPIIDFVDVALPAKNSGAKWKIDEVRAAIVQGIQARKWVPQQKEGNSLNASVLVRGKHYAEVTITFTVTSYSIVYAASRELDVNEQKRKIHGKYNQWVGALNTSIGQQLWTRASAQ